VGVNDLLSDVGEFCNRWAEITNQINAEIEDMAPYIEGRARSQYPLGSKFLLNRGHELQELVFAVEQSLRKVAAR
jgi:hypothetical protein